MEVSVAIAKRSRSPTDVLFNVQAISDGGGDPMKNFKALFAITVVMALRAGSDANSAAAQSSMTYESLKDFPDFAGAWTPLTPPFVLAPPVPGPQGAPPRAGACDLPPEYKAEVGARCREAVQARGARPDPCAPRPYFTGNPPRGPGGAFEILFTPGRVTIAVESGLVRRIYLQDRPPAGALDVSKSGTSIGRWDGATLVVETTGLDPNAQVVPGSVLGPDARVVERIALVDAETLRIDTTLTAPSLLSAPRSTGQVYRRARERVFTDFEICVEGDRSFDRVTGQDRFVTTPPADLPPPPRE
jgi:hypothetical protein